MLEWKAVSWEFPDSIPPGPARRDQADPCPKRGGYLAPERHSEPQSFPASPPAPFQSDLGLGGPLRLGASPAPPRAPNFLGSAVRPRGRTGRIYALIHLGSTLNTGREGPERFTYSMPRPQHTHLTNGETEAQRVEFEEGFSRFSGLHRQA